MSGESSTISPPKGQHSYKRLPKVENDGNDGGGGTAMHHDGGNDLDGHESNSLVVVDDSRMSKSIFRRSSWNDDSKDNDKKDDDGDDDDDDDDDDEMARAVASTSSTAASSGLRVDGDAGSFLPASASSPLHVSMVSAGSNSSSRAGSFDLDSDWDDDDDVEAGLRRYHFDNNITAPQQVPMPAEFSHDSFPKRLWQSFLELRTAARQRTAARLLTMPSESFGNRLQACLVTWFCDATDRGIMLVAGLLCFWLAVGVLGRMPAGWWWWGLFLFLLRVSARRLYESYCSVNARRRHRVRTSERDDLPTGTADVGGIGVGTSWQKARGHSDSSSDMEMV